MKSRDFFFDAFGPVTVRKMFGGAGIYHEGLIFALEGDGEILLKADAGQRARLRGGRGAAVHL